MLEAIGLTKHFGGLVAVQDVNLNVHEKEIVGLIGPNGAGKTTILNMLAGTLRPGEGKVIFGDEDVTSLPPHRRTQRGIARVFQSNSIFQQSSVATNVRTGFHLNSKTGFWKTFFSRNHSTERREEVLYEKAMEILRLVGIYEERNKIAASLPHASQRMLCLGIALATQPRLLLLDEPVTGMSGEEVDKMLSVIRALRDEKEISFLVVEHNMRAVMNVCERIAVLNFGRKIAEGCPGEIREDSTVIEAYLGVEEDAI